MMDRGPRCSCREQRVRRGAAETHQPMCSRRLWLERETLEHALRGAIAGLVGSDPVPPSEGEISKWRALLPDHCTCKQFCGDCDEDGPGTCKALPRAPRAPDVEIVVVRRR